MTEFSPTRWFWKADDGRIYGSAAARAVSATDAGYAAFVEAGGIATVWPRDAAGAQTDASLDETLVFYGLPPIGGISVATLAAALVSATTAACAALTLQVVPDAVHQNAYVNAAAMVGPSAAVPTAEPMKSAFAALAAAAGIEPATFATTVVAIAAVSCQLQAAQVTATRAAAAAKTVADLASALTAFEAALAAIVAAIRASGVTISPPAAITIAGIGA